MQGIHLPLRVITEGLTLKIQDGEASEEADRRHILNFIAGQPLEATPPLQHHPSYTRINQRLHAVFALQVWKQAVEQGKVDELHLPEALSEDENRTSLDMDFTRCEKLTDTRSLGNGIAGLRALTCLQLKFDGCFYLQCVDGLGQGLSHLVNLRSLGINLHACHALVSVKGMCQGISNLRNLNCLAVNMSYCFKLESLAGFDEALANTINLAQLKLECEGCESLLSAQPIAQGLQSNASIVECHLSFATSQQHKSRLDMPLQKVFTSREEFMAIVMAGSPDGGPKITRVLQ